MEQWKCFIKNDSKRTARYTGCISISYLVSNLGNIKVIREKKDGTLIEKPYSGVCRQYKNRGYLSLRIGKKSYRVHRLVAESFVDGRTKEKNVVNHKDSNPLNNVADNLEWLTVKENIRYSYRNGNGTRMLSEEKIKKLKKELYSDTCKNLAKKYGCTHHIVADIRRGKIYTFDI
jgi:hypothetical protein